MIAAWQANRRVLYCARDDPAKIKAPKIASFNHTYNALHASQTRKKVP